MRRYPSSGRPRAAGLSLIELMVAMAIGLLLLLGLMQVMGASQASYRLSQGIARTQENARFAMDFIQRDVRMAGHLGCVNDQSRMLQGAEGVSSHTATDLRFDLGVQGFEAPGSAPGASMSLVGGTPVPAPSNNWSPQLPAGVAALGPVAGSDVLMVRYLAPVGVGLADNGFESLAAGGIRIHPVTVPNAALEGIDDGDTSLFGISDCVNASIFPGKVDLGDGVVTFTPGAGASGFGGSEIYQSGQAMLYRAHSVVFYVAPGANPDNPSLWRASAEVDGSWRREELVEGIESMQLLFGRDYAGVGTRPTGSITRSDIASSIGGGATTPNAAQSDDWRRVGDVQVGLLMRSSARASAEQAGAGSSVLGTRMTLAANDGYYRSAYETTVALRNRLFGN